MKNTEIKNSWKQDTWFFVCLCLRAIAKFFFHYWNMSQIRSWNSYRTQWIKEWLESTAMDDKTGWQALLFWTQEKDGHSDVFYLWRFCTKTVILIKTVCLHVLFYTLCQWLSTVFLVMRILNLFKFSNSFLSTLNIYVAFNTFWKAVCLPQIKYQVVS